MSLAEWTARLLEGLWVTLRLIALSAPAGLAIGVMAGVARTYAPAPLRFGAFVYQTVFRGVPLLVQLFILYYGLPKIGIRLSPWTAAVLGFALCSGAYHSEYVRSALGSIATGQMEAGRALGMGRIRTIRSIILPQAFRRALPGLANEVIYLVKYSSLAYLVTLVDLTGQGRLIAYQTFRFFETFTIVGLIYLMLVSIVATGFRGIERRLHVPF